MQLLLEVPNWDQRNISRKGGKTFKLGSEKKYQSLLTSPTNLHDEPEILPERWKIFKICFEINIFNFIWLTTTKEFNLFSFYHTILLPFDRLSLPPTSVCFLWSKKKMFPQYCLSSSDKAGNIFASLFLKTSRVVGFSLSSNCLICCIVVTGKNAHICSHNQRENCTNALITKLW